MKNWLILIAIIVGIILILPFVLLILSAIVQIIWGLWIDAWKVLSIAW